jgi:hypothetical protein
MILKMTTIRVEDIQPPTYFNIAQSNLKGKRRKHFSARVGQAMFRVTEEFSDGNVRVVHDGSNAEDAVAAYNALV